MRHRLKKISGFFQNGIEIPKELSHSKEYKVLHLSDTPSLIYPAVNNMIRTLGPDLIIHTGDIADDIKLEGNIRCLAHYRRTAGPFLEYLVQSAPKLYIVPGNHDHIPFIADKVPPGSVLNPGLMMDIEGHSFGVAHLLKDLPEGARYNLFGHNFDMPENKTDSVFLNGVRAINVILLPSERILGLSYPGSTNHCRKYRNNPPTLI